MSFAQRLQEVRTGFERPFLTTIPKLRITSTAEGIVSPSARRGSLKKMSTAISIRKTLTAAMRKTFSTRMWLWIHPARNGPMVLPMFTMV